MEYREEQFLKAFGLYTQLAAKGELLKLDASVYYEDNEIKAILDNYVRAVQCTLISDTENLYLVPVSMESPFHITNDAFKKEYLMAKAVNMDIYLLYLAVIVLFGCFYDSYQTADPADFVTMDRWLETMDQRVAAILQQEEVFLREKEVELNFNWVTLSHKWSDMDGIRETVKKQDARTVSRLSFLNIVKDFLIRQHLVTDLGQQELELTEKAKTIVRLYYMEMEYNKGIFDFMYSCDHQPQSNGGDA